jgi:hypothetical protein
VQAMNGRNTRGCLLALAALMFGLGSASGADTSPAARIKIAVFNFELDDLTPAAALLNQATSDQQALDKASAAARQQLADSGRYEIVDVSKADGTAVKTRALRDCDGCEAALARELGADQSLIGIVRRATQTDYYVVLLIRDAKTGKPLDEQSANFAGGPEGWASGTRMLIKHQVLVSQD